MPTTCTYAALAAAALAGRAGRPALVGVDGLAGAGKTTLAERLAAAAGGAPVVHTDDFASHADFLGWWPRLLAEVVEPLLAGRPATFAAYDWVARRPGPTVTVAPAPLVVIEGVGATRRAWRDALALRVWVQAPRELRRRRGLDRDGPELAAFWQEWMAAEDAYVAEEDPAAAADLVVDGTARLDRAEVVLARGSLAG